MRPRSQRREAAFKLASQCNYYWQKARSTAVWFVLYLLCVRRPCPYRHHRLNSPQGYEKETKTAKKAKIVGNPVKRQQKETKEMRGTGERNRFSTNPHTGGVSVPRCRLKLNPRGGCGTGNPNNKAKHKVVELA